MGRTGKWGSKVNEFCDGCDRERCWVVEIVKPPACNFAHGDDSAVVIRPRQSTQDAFQNVSTQHDQPLVILGNRPAETAQSSRTEVGHVRVDELSPAVIASCGEWLGTADVRYPPTETRAHRLREFK